MGTIASLLLWLTLSRGLYDLPALPVDPRLAAVAQARADSIAATGRFTHCLPGTGPCVYAFVGLDRTAGIPLDTALGENLYGTTTPDGPDMGRDATLAWLASPGHLRNITNPAYRRVGFGLAVRAGGITASPLPGPWTVIVEELSGGMR